MSWLNKKSILLLTGLFAACFLILFVVRWSGVPLSVRYVLSPSIIQAAGLVYFFVLKPEKPVRLALSLGLFLVVPVGIVSFIDHTLIWKDIGSEGFAGRIAFLLGVVYAVPLIAGLIFALVQKLKGEKI